MNKLKRRRVSCKTCRHNGESNDHRISHSINRISLFVVSMDPVSYSSYCSNYSVILAVNDTFSSSSSLSLSFALFSYINFMSVKFIVSHFLQISLFLSPSILDHTCMVTGLLGLDVVNIHM